MGLRGLECFRVHYWVHFGSFGARIWGLTKQHSANVAVAVEINLVATLIARVAAPYFPTDAAHGRVARVKERVIGLASPAFGHDGGVCAIRDWTLDAHVALLTELTAARQRQASQSQNRQDLSSTDSCDEVHHAAIITWDGFRSQREGIESRSIKAS